MSRKLLFVKGMLVCLFCDKHFAGTPKEKPQELVEAKLLTICFDLCRRSALDLLAEALTRFARPEIGRSVLSAYNEFLTTMNDGAKRQALKKLAIGETSDALFKEERDNTRAFRDGLETLFFDSDKKLSELTRRYGVF